MTFGVLAALATRASTSRSVTARRAAKEEAGIEVAEKTDTKVVPYLQNIPRTIMDKRTLDKLLATVPREQWEDPPPDTYLYTLKCFAEVYGEGKATKMGWWDYWYMKINTPDSEEFMGQEGVIALNNQLLYMSQGKVPLYI